MSETADMQSKAGATTADKQALAQVEKWMAMIRELNGERQEPAQRHG
jgi:hypothetical protein